MHVVRKVLMQSGNGVRQAESPTGAGAGAEATSTGECRILAVVLGFTAPRFARVHG